MRRPNQSNEKSNVFVHACAGKTHMISRPEMAAMHLYDQIKSKLLVLGAVNTTINDQGCQHVTGKFESIRKLLNKPAGWPKFVQSHLTVKTVE